MRVERQGRFIHIAIKNGNQERWFNIEEHEAQELALRLGEALSEPKKPKFVVGDRVRIIKNVWDKDVNLKGQEFTIKALKPFNTNSAILWGTPCVFDLSWLEKIEGG